MGLGRRHPMLSVILGPRDKVRNKTNTVLHWRNLKIRHQYYTSLCFAVTYDIIWSQVIIHKCGMTRRYCYVLRLLVALNKIFYMLILIKCFSLHNSQPGHLGTNFNDTIIIPNKYWIPPCELPSDSVIHSLNFWSGNLLHVGGEFLKPSQVNKWDECGWLSKASIASSFWNTKTIQLKFYSISIKPACYGLNVLLLKMSSVEALLSNAPVCGDMAFMETIEVEWGHYGEALVQGDWCPFNKRHQKAQGPSLFAQQQRASVRAQWQGGRKQALTRDWIG